MSEPLPQRPKIGQLLFSYNRQGTRWPGATRAALALLIPGGVALLLGHPDAILLIAAGAFTVVYGEGHPYRTRARVLATAGTLLVLAATGGFLVGTLAFSPGHGPWWGLLVGIFSTFLAVLGTFTQNALRLPAPGCFFIVMVGGGSTMLARTDIHLAEVALWAAVGAGTGCALGMLPGLMDPRGPQRRAVEALEHAVQRLRENGPRRLVDHHHAQLCLSTAWQALSDAGMIRGGRLITADPDDLVGRALAAQQDIVKLNPAIEADAVSRRTQIPLTRPTARYRLYRSAVVNSHASLSAQKVLISCLITVVIGIALGLGRPDWGAVSALLILQWGPDRIPGSVRALHRMLGSMLGVGVFSLIHAFDAQGWALLVVLAICQFWAEIFVARNYGLCLIFSTPMALLMGNSSHAPLIPTISARLAEVGLSVLLALAVLWLWRPRAEVKNHRRLQVRVVESMSTLLGLLHLRTPDEALAARRDLQYELLSERSAGVSMALNEPSVAKDLWATHVQLQRAGYHLLDFCSARPDRLAARSELNVVVGKIREVDAAI